MTQTDLSPLMQAGLMHAEALYAILVMIGIREPGLDQGSAPRDVKAVCEYLRANAMP